MQWVQTLRGDAGTCTLPEPVMDEQSFADFHARTARPLWAYLTRASGNATLADDLTQESFLRFLRSAPWDAGEVACRRYLFKIATNLMRDHWRRPQHGALEDVAERHLGTDGGVNPAALAQKWDNEARLAPALARLAPRERQLLWLAYVEGEKHRDIAAITGLRTASVRILLFRARRHLASLLPGEPA